MRVRGVSWAHSTSALAIGLGLGIAGGLLALWSVVNREDMAGVAPAHNVFRVMMLDESLASIGGPEMERVVAAAFPGSRKAIVRYVRSDMETAPGRRSLESMALYSGPLFDILGVPTGQTNAAYTLQSRAAIATRAWVSKAGRDAAALQVDFYGTHPETANQPQRFDIVGHLPEAFDGISLGRTPLLWMHESSSRYWLIGKDEPVMVLDFMFPPDSAIVELREPMTAEDVASRIVAAGRGLGLNITAHAIKGAARDPRTLTDVRNRSTLFSVLGALLFVVATGAGIAMWFIGLHRTQASDRIRMLLGEQLRAARRRAAKQWLLPTALLVALSISVTMIIARFAAMNPPFDVFSAGPLLLSGREWIRLAGQGVVLISIVTMALLLMSFAAVGKVHAVRARSPRRPVAMRWLLAVSMGFAVVAAGLSMGLRLAGRHLSERDYGFDTSELYALRIEKDPENAMSWAFDQRPISALMGDVRETVGRLSGAEDVAVSSQSPFEAYPGMSFRLSTDAPFRVRMGAQVAISSNFLSLLKVSGTAEATGIDQLSPNSDHVLVDEPFAREVLGVLDLNGAAQIDSPDLGGRHGLLRAAGSVPGFFRADVNGTPIPTVFKFAKEYRELEWLWFRSDRPVDRAALQSEIKRVLEAHGMTISRVELTSVQAYIASRMKGDVLQQRLMAGASYVLLALALTGFAAVFALSGSMQGKAIAVRLALGGTQLKATLQCVLPSVWMIALSVVVGVLVVSFWLRIASVIYGFDHAQRMTIPIIAVVATMAVAALIVPGLAYRENPRRLVALLKGD